MGSKDIVRRPLRVLFIIPGEVEGSSMIFVKREVTAVQEAGITGRVFFLRSRTSLRVLAMEWLRLRRELREFMPDLVHAHFGTVTGFFCAVGTCLPLVVTYRGNDINPDPSVSWVRSACGRLLSQLAALRARQIICVSPELKGKLWWSGERADVIPAGVDTRLFYPRPKGDMRAILGWTAEGRVVLFNAGGDPRIKRLDIAQAAVDIARGLCGDIQFVVTNREVPPEQMPILMNAADCLLLTSDCEGSPNVVKEAIACNLPVVSVDVGDVRERLAAVQPSRIVRRDPYELGAAVAEILTKGVRSNGSTVIRELALENVAQRMVTVYQAAAG